MVAEMTEAGAAEHLDCLASKYAGQPVRFFGDAMNKTPVSGQKSAPPKASVGPTVS